MPDSRLAPADTTMMGVVHDALRRDLKRLQDTLGTAMVSSTDDERRKALAAHAEWMMIFLHHHHQAEDDGLWPQLYQQAPGASDLLHRMEADHERVIPGIDRVQVAAARYAADRRESARLGLLDAIDDLSEALLPHLRSEEDEAMPVVSATLTDAQWRAWDQKYNVGGKSLNRLAIEGHWLMDGLDPRRCQVLIHLVPAPARFIILKGFARRYRAACALRWGPDVVVTALPT